MNIILVINCQIMTVELSDWIKKIKEDNRRTFNKWLRHSQPIEKILIAKLRRVTLPAVVMLKCPIRFSVVLYMPYFE